MSRPIVREIIEAGAGCGKTRGLVYRYIQGLGYDPENGQALGKFFLEPREITALTFTEDAAAEMRDRVLKRLDEIGLARLRAAVIEESRIGTFHSLCLKLLRPHLSRLGYGGSGQLVPSVAAFDARVRHALKKLSEHPRGAVLLRHMDLRSLTELSAQLWFRVERPNDPEAAARSFESILAAFENSRKRFETFRETCSGEVRDFLRASPSFAVEAPKHWIFNFLKSLEELSPDAAALMNFRKTKFDSKLPAELKPKAQIWRALLKKNIAESLSRESLALDEEVQRELARFFADLREGGPKILDFAALEFELHHLLTSKPDLRLMPAPKLLLVDEFQDTNRVQYDILRALSADDTEWHFVGDPKQSIYKFRGAEVSLFTSLTRQLTRRELNHNYRSVSPALEFMNLLQGGLFSGARPLDPPEQALHSGLENRAKDELIVNLKAPPHAPIRVFERPPRESFAADLITSFRRRREELGPTSTHAALFTSWSNLYATAAELAKAEIPFTISGSEPYLDHHLTGIFAAALEWLENPKLAQGAVALTRWRDLDEWKPELPSPEKLAELAAFFGAGPTEASWLTILHRFTVAVQPSRWHRGAEWSAAMERLLTQLEQIGLPHSMTWTDLAQFLKRHSGEFDADVPGVITAAAARGTLSLYTVHGSKGLEFDAVYLPQFVERAKATRSSGLSDDADAVFKLRLRGADGDVGTARASLFFLWRERERDNEAEAENRRLFYVAVTRAVRTIDLFFHSPTDKTAEDPDPLAFLGWPGKTVQEWNKILVQLRTRGAFTDLEERGFLSWHSFGVADESVTDDETEKKEAPPPWLWPRAMKAFPRGREFRREGVSAYIERHFPKSIRPFAARTEAPPLGALSSAEMGTEVHKVLEIWNGDAAVLDALLPSIGEREIIGRAVAKVRSLPELAELWAALGDGAETSVRREFGLYVHSDAHRLSGYADLVWFKGDRLVLIDWKTSSKLGALTRPERIEKIRMQLRLYAQAFGPRFPRVQGLAVGIELGRGDARVEIILNEEIGNPSKL